jgi:hypothetical protein
VSLPSWRGAGRCTCAGLHRRARSRRRGFRRACPPRVPGQRTRRGNASASARSSGCVITPTATRSTVVVSSADCGARPVGSGVGQTS